MKNILMFLISGLCGLLPGAAGAQNLTGHTVSVHDSAGTVRQTFSNAETITLRQKVSAASSPNSVVFTFKIIDPTGSTRFILPGNSASGPWGATPTGTQAQLAGISINSFYTTPGSYVFKGEVALDGPPEAQQVSFLISSPNITLIYPPYGARGLADKPLTFRWSASGASRYRVTVSDNAGLYNPMHTALNAGESLYSYPDNPSQPREQLVPEQVYYWKVEGLDASNNKISESNVYNFSLKGLASAQTRNVAITSLDLASPAVDFNKPIDLRAVLYNSGSATESNISVKMSLGGIAAQDSPRQVITIGPGDKVNLSFTAFMPAGQSEGLAVACADLFDDNMADNCKTRLIAKDAGQTGPAGPVKKLSYEEMFQAILKRLGPEAAKALEGYTFESLSCANCSQDELAAVIAALISGDAQLVGASVTDEGGGASPTQTAQAEAAADPGAEGEAPAAEETSLEVTPLKEETPGEWTGYTEARGKEASVLVLRDMKEWKKTWKTLSSEEPPELDFAALMVVGIISGSDDKAETVRLLGRRKTDDGIAFDYYQIEAAAGAAPPMAAYIFRVYNRSDEKVSFTRLDVKK